MQGKNVCIMLSASQALLNRYAPFLCLFVILAACAPATSSNSNSRVTNPELAAYNTIVLEDIVANNNQRDPYSLEPIIRARLESAGVRVLSSASSSQLSLADISRTLWGYVSYDWTPTFGGSYATLVLELYDALGREVYRAQGTNQGLTYTADAQGAARNAANVFVRDYPGFDSSIESDVQRVLQSWPRIQRTEQSTRAYLDSNVANLNPVEGVWVASDSTYWLSIQETSAGRFDATILSTGSPIWLPGMVKMILSSTAIPNTYSVTYYMGNLTAVGRTASVQDGVLVIPQLPDGFGNFIDLFFLKTYPTVQVATIEDADSTPSQDRQEPLSSVSGTGFLVRRDGLIATNAHVVADRGNVQITLGIPRQTYAGELVLLDRDNDLALLRLIGFVYDDVFSVGIPYIVVDSANLAVGDSILAAGYPVSSILGGELRVTDGIVSSQSGVHGAPNLLQITNPLQPGNSGGPIFDSQGNVVGVAVASVNASAFLGLTGTLPQNINFAVKSSYLNNLLAMVPSAEVASATAAFEPVAARDIVARSAPFIASIEAH